MTYVDRLVDAKSGRDWKLFSMALAGEPLSPTDLVGMTDADLKQAIEIHLAALLDPAQAWDLCSKAPPGVLRLMSPGAAVLLASEFERAGDPELAARLLERDVGLWIPNDAVFEYVRTGKKHPDFWRVDPELRAALAFVRARHLASRGEPASELLAEVARLDHLQMVVTRAQGSWPPVVPPPAPGKLGKKAEKAPKTDKLMIDAKAPSGVLRRISKPSPG
jgi:hypothetical protein